MPTVENIEGQIRNALASAELSQSVDWEQTQVLNLGGDVFVEVVLDEVALVPQVQEMLDAVLPKDEYLDLIVRGKWKIESVDDVQTARTPDGALVAAFVVPVTLRSGQTLQQVHVVVSYEAQKAFERMLGVAYDPKAVAELRVNDSLILSGASYWNPQTTTRLEVNSGTAGYLSRQLRQAA